MALQDDWMRLTIRMPPDLHSRIQRSAAEKSQPINSEIIEALNKEYPETSPMVDLFNQIWSLFESIDDRMDSETAKKIGEVLVSFTVLASKENPKLKPFADKAIQARAARSLGKNGS